MKIIRNIDRIHKELKLLKLNKKRIGFIPTMGALHEGHASLIRQARKDNDIVVVSIFVNPAQFGPKEDYKKYPRVLRKDAQVCKKEKTDYIFYPAERDMYQNDYLTYVEVQKLSGLLCGKFRPGHFKGVTTIVLKLLNIIIPDIAYFGLKDYQQYRIIKKMVENINLDVIITGMPLVRENDGLAISSRNQYLDPGQRDDALLLSISLFHARDLIKNGEKNSERIKKVILNILLKGKFINRNDIDYISIIHPETLEEIKTIKNDCVIALAVNIRGTRLIDNIIIKDKK